MAAPRAKKKPEKPVFKGFINYRPLVQERRELDRILEEEHPLSAEMINGLLLAGNKVGFTYHEDGSFQVTLSHTGNVKENLGWVVSVRNADLDRALLAIFRYHFVLSDGGEWPDGGSGNSDEW